MLTVYSLSVAHVNDRVTSAEILEAARTRLLLYGIGAAFGPMVAGTFLEHFGSPALPVISASVLLVLAAVAIRQTLTKAPAAAAERTHFVPLSRTSQAAMDMLPEATGVTTETDPEEH